MYWIFVVLICVVSVYGKSTCNSTYKSENGTIRYSKGSSAVLPNVICTWTIISEENSTIFLVFDDLVLYDDDQISVVSSGAQLPFSPINSAYFGKPGTISFLTDRTNIAVTLSTGKSIPQVIRSFQMHYYQNHACNHTFSNSPAGIFHSPWYGSVLPIKCFFKVSVQDKNDFNLNLWFTNVTLSDAKINVQGSDGQDGTFDSTNLPGFEFLSADFITIGFSVENQTDADSSFTVHFDAVQKVSGYQRLHSDTRAADLSSPTSDELRSIISKPKQHNLACLWLLQCDEGQVLTVSFKNVNLPEVQDQLIILDGPNRSSPVLLDMSATKKDFPVAVYSTGSSLWVTATSVLVTEDFAIKLEISQANSGGYYKNMGNISASHVSSTSFLLEVQQGQQVKLNIDKSSVPSGGGKLVFASDFVKGSKPFATLSAGQTVDFVVSPTEKMAVLLNNFDSSSFMASFFGVEEGCYELATGSGDTFSVSGNCNNTCTWTVNPHNVSETDILTFHFSTLALSGNDLVLIRLLDALQTLVANLSMPTTSLVDLWLPAATGAYFQVMRSNCNLTNSVVKASYIVMPKCESVLTPEPGQTIHLISPNFPSLYPLGVNCSWTVVLPKGATFLHVAVVEIQLAHPTHHLKFFKKQDGSKVAIISFDGPNVKLPDDIPVNTDLVVEFDTSLIQFESQVGFNVTVTAVEDGSLFVNSSGELHTSGFPKPVENGSVFSWFIHLNPKASERVIVIYEFSNQTPAVQLDGILEIYDGSSSRSPLVKNFTQTQLLSRTESLVVIYRRSNLTVSGPAFSLTYDTFPCNMSLMCDNLICMHEDWLCNGHNDCGDYSDERNCEGRAPPTPFPPTTPAPVVKESGYSGLALGLCFLFALVIGGIVGIGAPYAYKRIKNRSPRYSAFESADDN